MAMHDPPHPGEFIREVYLRPHGLSVRSLAENLGVAPSTLNRIISGQSGVSPEMALRLSKALGRSAESWMAMQHNHDLWNARRRTDLSTVSKVAFEAAWERRTRIATLHTAMHQLSVPTPDGRVPCVRRVNSRMAVSLSSAKLLSLPPSSTSIQRLPDCLNGGLVFKGSKIWLELPAHAITGAHMGVHRRAVANGAEWSLDPRQASHAKTGTRVVIRKCTEGLVSVALGQKGSRKEPYASEKMGEVGSPGRARTADLVINSHPLYQLSYRGIIRTRMVLVVTRIGQY